MSVTLWEELKFSRHVLALARDPTQTFRIRRLAEVSHNFKDPAPLYEVLNRARRDPGFRSLADSGYRPPLPDLERLATLPEGTLGREFAEHMFRNRLEVDFLQPAATRPELRYLPERQIRTHDIQHVLTGYDTSIAGELALQMFSIAQLPTGINVAIVVAGVMNRLRANPGEIGELFDFLVEGYQRGKRSRFLLGIPWEDHWEKPLEELRAMAEIPPLAPPVRTERERDS